MITDFLYFLIENNLWLPFWVLVGFCGTGLIIFMIMHYKEIIITVLYLFTLPAWAVFSLLYSTLAMTVFAFKGEKYKPWRMSGVIARYYR